MFKQPRWHRQNGTRLLACENVVTGTIHKECTECLTKDGMYSTKTIHTATSDVGQGAIKRFRGWSLARASCRVNFCSKAKLAARNKHNHREPGLGD